MIMDYLLKASAVLFIFYACYQLFLQKETFFQANRWFLLSGLIISSLIPLIVIPVYIEYTVTNTSNFIINTKEATPQIIIEEPFDYTQLLIWFYFTGIIFFFGKLSSEFLSLRNVLNSSKIRSSGQIKLLETKRNIAPFSFFNRIVYNPKQFEDEELTHIINHEKAHCKEFHSIDTIIAQISCILFWFNPIIWLYKKALQQNLEFIADLKAQQVSFCKKSYQTVLLKASVKNHQLAITNTFYTSLIKKRIVMLHKSKSSKINHLKMIFVIPLLGLFIMSFNTKEVYIEKPSEEKSIVDLIQPENIEQLFNKDLTNTDLAEIKKDLSSKGVTFKYSGIKRNKKGEITAIETEFEYNGNSGIYTSKSDKIIEPFIFKTSKDLFIVGTFTDDTKTILTNNGNTKLQSTTNNSFNVKQKDTLYIQTQSNGLMQERDTIFINRNSNNQTWSSKDGIKTIINASENRNTNLYANQAEEPLFVVNGEIVKQSVFENINSDDIISMTVLKEKAATKAYGKKDKNGVIIIKEKYKKPNSTTRLYKDDNDYLYILDGKEISESDLEKVYSKETVLSLEVLEEKEAIEKYGEKGINGVVEVISKTNNNTINSKTFVFTSNKNTHETDRSRNIETYVTTIIYEDDDKTVSAEFILTKNSSDAFLEKQKRELKTHGIEAKFSKVRRNNAGEITSIKISLDDNNGRKSSASWKEKDQTIPDIVMGKSKDDKLFVRAIGN